MTAPVITFLSDFGYEDEFVGVCHGVIAKRCPSARVIDVSHGVARHDVRAGALTLRAALAYLPAGVHLAIVDPGVGLDDASSAAAGARRAVAIEPAAGEHLLVGPDNGVLSLAAAQLGGVVGAADLGRSPERLEPVSATFHGRDIFAPVAAALACGKTLEEVGETIDADGLATLELPRAQTRDGALHTHVIALDHFGNVTLAATTEDLSGLGAQGGAELDVQRAAARPRDRAGRLPVRYARTFGEVPPGVLVLYEDSRNMLALAANRGSAAALLEVEPGDEVVLRTR
jgi:S-adenosylmethionine hydrolase